MQTSESTASLSEEERWTITEIRRQVNFVLTNSLLIDVLFMTVFFLLSISRTRERELVKPFYFLRLTFRLIKSTVCTK